MNKSLLNSVKIDFKPDLGDLNSNFFNSNSYGFNGMEKDDEHTQGKYDFGARIYDARLGRWLAVDPKFGIYAGVSPLSSFGNNPIFWMDKGGETLYIGELNRDAHHLNMIK